MSDFLDGWTRTIRLYGENISSDDDISEQEFRFYRFFERNFEITIRVTLSEFNNIHPAERRGEMFRLATSIIEDITDVAIEAAKIENSHLCLRLTKITIEVGLGFGNQVLIRQLIIGGLNRIKSENDCGKRAVKQALSGLQEPPVEYMERTGMPHDSPWQFNLINYTFDSREEFVEAVNELQNEVTDQ